MNVREEPASHPARTSSDRMIIGVVNSQCFGSERPKNEVVVVFPPGGQSVVLDRAIARSLNRRMLHKNASHRVPILRHVGCRVLLIRVVPNIAQTRFAMTFVRRRESSSPSICSSFQTRLAVEDCAEPSAWLAKTSLA